MSAVKFSEKINEIQSSNHEIQVNLKKQLEVQIELNNKWKYEVHEITDKLQKRLIQLKAEVSLLKKENKDLELKCRNSETKVNEYRVGLETLCIDVNNVMFS